MSKCIFSTESVLIESCLGETTFQIRSGIKFVRAPDSSKRFRFVSLQFIKSNIRLLINLASNSFLWFVFGFESWNSQFPLINLGFFYRDFCYLLNLCLQCDVIQRNIATFEVPYDTASADIDRRKLRFLREKIADEFLMRYAVMGLPRSERILPHIQVMTLF